MALVDLQKLLTGFGKRDEVQASKTQEPHYHEGNCVNVYTSPFVFQSNMANSSCLALTSTHMAWVGTFDKVRSHPVPAELQQAGVNCENVYKSERCPTVVWIDFNKLRTNETDNRRLEQEQRRKECLQTCQIESNRRRAARGRTYGRYGTYDRRSEREVATDTHDADDSMDRVSTLLNVGEFLQLSQWIDWDAVYRERGEPAMTELGRKVEQYEQQIMAAESNQFDPDFIDDEDDEIDQQGLDMLAALGGAGNAHMQQLMEMLAGAPDPGLDLAQDQLDEEMLDELAEGDNQ